MGNKRFVVLIVVLALVAGIVPALLRRQPPPPLTPAAGAPARPAVEPASDAHAGEAAAPSGAKVGFIDLETVYNQCKQTKAFDTEMAKFMEDAKRQLEPLAQEIGRLEERYGMLAPQSPERSSLETEIREKKKACAIAQEPWEKDLNKKSLVTRERIYNLIRASVQKVARSRGIDLVLADVEEPHANFTGPSSREFEAALREYSVKMQRKSVLYASKDVDLTAAVLEAVNAEP